MEMIHIAGWFLLVVGGLLVLGAIIAVLVFVFFAGAPDQQSDKDS